MVRTGTDCYNQNRGFNFARAGSAASAAARTRSATTPAAASEHHRLGEREQHRLPAHGGHHAMERLGLTINLGGNRRVRTVQTALARHGQAGPAPGMYNMSNAAIDLHADAVRRASAGSTRSTAPRSSRTTTTSSST